MKVSLIKPIKVYITPLALHKMSLYCKLSNDEIGWLGTVKRLSRDFLIEDTYLPAQETNLTTCELTPEGINELVNELLQQPNGLEVCNSLKMWGHSHVNMDPSPSSQDDDQLEEFLEHNEWFIRLITNRKGEFHISLFDQEKGIIIEDMDWEIYLCLGMESEIEKEVEEKVSRKTYPKNVSKVIPGGNFVDYPIYSTVNFHTIDDVYKNIDAVTLSYLAEVAKDEGLDELIREIYYLVGYITNREVDLILEAIAGDEIPLKKEGYDV